jgi:enoyl-CoA hydratase/carnithine racemase
LTATPPGPRAGDPPSGDHLGTPYLRFERRGPIAWCIVDRPDARNALTPAMYFGIRRAVDIVNRDLDLAGLILTGTGDVFIPGGELRDRAPDDWIDLVEVFGMDHIPFEAVRRSVKPVVCAVNGHCMGGGLQLAMLCDIAVVSEEARLRIPELLVGVTDTWFLQTLPAHVGVAVARDLLLSAREFTAAEALRWGMVSRVVPKAEVESAATEAMIQLGRAAPGARSFLKRELQERYGSFDRVTLDAGLLSDEFAEGKQAFEERRSPSWIPPEFRPNGRL